MRESAMGKMKTLSNCENNKKHNNSPNFSCFAFINPNLAQILRDFAQILRHYAQSCNCIIAAFRNTASRTI